MVSFVLFVVFIGLGSAAEKDFKKVCYFPNWGQYRPGSGAFFPENINTSLCTHLIYAFAKVSNNELTPVEWNDESTDFMKGMYERFTDLKKKNNKLKVILAVGGWNAGMIETTKMLSTKENRKHFIYHSISFLRKRNFDGLDLDFEFPGVGSSPPEDKERLTLFIQEARRAYNQESQETGRLSLLLTCAIPADKRRIEAGFDLKNIKDNLDIINIMSYDYHGHWEFTAGHLSPLYSSDELNMNWSANYVKKQGVEPSKMVLGIPLYGRSYTLANPNNHDIGAPTVGPGPAGSYSQTPGILSYYEICNMYISNHQTAFHWSEEQQVRYLTNQNVWIGYEDEKSLTIKLQYLKSKNYGGWMVWDVSFDDFNGKFCGRGSNPLLKTLNGEKPIAIPQTKPEVVTPPSQPEFDCKNSKDGLYADPLDCKKFIHCSNGLTYHMNCPAKLCFNPTIGSCDWLWRLSADRKKLCAIQ